MNAKEQEMYLTSEKRRWFYLEFTERFGILAVNEAVERYLKWADNIYQEKLTAVLDHVYDNNNGRKPRLPALKAAYALLYPTLSPEPKTVVKDCHRCNNGGWLYIVGRSGNPLRVSCCCHYGARVDHPYPQYLAIKDKQKQREFISMRQRKDAAVALQSFLTESQCLKFTGAVA